jgi:hypothetical protein
MVDPVHPPDVPSADAQAFDARVRWRYTHCAVLIVGLPVGPLLLEVSDATHPEPEPPAQVNRRVPAVE